MSSHILGVGICGIVYHVLFYSILKLEVEIFWFDGACVESIHKRIVAGLINLIGSSAYASATNASIGITHHLCMLCRCCGGCLNLWLNWRCYRCCCCWCKSIWFKLLFKVISFSNRWWRCVNRWWRWWRCVNRWWRWWRCVNRWRWCYRCVNIFTLLSRIINFLRRCNVVVDISN